MTCLHKLASGPMALAVTSAVLLLSGCASPSLSGGGGDVGFSAAARLSDSRTGLHSSVAGRLPRNEDDARALSALIAEKLQQPLSADDAVQIALLNNRGLQASYWSLGIAEADLVQAGRLHNPMLGFKRTHEGGEVAIERTLTFNLVSLLTMPLAGRIEARRYEQSTLLVADAAFKVAVETRRAYIEAVAAAQGADYAQQVADSAQASAELAGRMRSAGNWSQLDLIREQAYHAQAVADVARARKGAVAAREQLTRLMGLGGGMQTGPQAGAQAEVQATAPAGAYSLPDHLPELPDAPRELAGVEQTAMRERLDLRAATLDTEQTAASLGLMRTTRFINVLDLGAVANSGAGGQAARGYELTLEVPLFDWGTARVARAEATYRQSLNRLAGLAVNARSEARASYADYRASYDLARHYRDQVLPLRKQISDQTLLRYNGMLLSVFELLADAREQAGAVNGYIAALKDYWIAEANLEAALGGRLPIAAAAQNTLQKPAQPSTQGAAP